MRPFLGYQGSIDIGICVVIESDAQDRPHGVVFEDEGRTGYFYARDYTVPEVPFVDALHIYDVGSFEDGTPCSLLIVWSVDWTKAALIINGVPHAVFDFDAKVGLSKNSFPDPDLKTGWSRKPWSADLKFLFFDK